MTSLEEQLKAFEEFSSLFHWTLESPVGLCLRNNPSCLIKQCKKGQGNKSHLLALPDDPHSVSQWLSNQSQLFDGKECVIPISAGLFVQLFAFFLQDCSSSSSQSSPKFLVHQPRYPLLCPHRDRVFRLNTCPPTQITPASAPFWNETMTLFLFRFSAESYGGLTFQGPAIKSLSEWSAWFLHFCQSVHAARVEHLDRIKSLREKKAFAFEKLCALSPLPRRSRSLGLCHSSSNFK